MIPTTIHEYHQCTSCHQPHAYILTFLCRFLIYGAFGMVITHELIHEAHGFDDEGNITADCS